MFTATTLWKQVYKYIYPVQFSSTNTWLFPFDFIYTNTVLLSQIYSIDNFSYQKREITGCSMIKKLDWKGTPNIREYKKIIQMK